MINKEDQSLNRIKNQVINNLTMNNLTINRIKNNHFYQNKKVNYIFNFLKNHKIKFY
jgi:hypothetical protein